MKNQLIIRELLTEKRINPSRVDRFDNMFWFNKYGEAHSIGDNPSVIYSNGTKFWHKNGKLHREEDKPAIIYPDGRKYWYKNGQLI